MGGHSTDLGDGLIKGDEEGGSNKDNLKFSGHVSKTFLLESRSIKFFCHRFMNSFREKAPLLLESKTERNRRVS